MKQLEICFKRCIQTLQHLQTFASSCVARFAKWLLSVSKRTYSTCLSFNFLTYSSHKILFGYSYSYLLQETLLRKHCCWQCFSVSKRAGSITKLCFATLVRKPRNISETFFVSRTQILHPQQNKMNVACAGKQGNILGNIEIKKSFRNNVSLFAMVLKEICHDNYFKSFLPCAKSPSNWRKPQNNSLLR